MNATPTRWTAESAGCIFAGASHRTADELCAAVILLALDEGWDPADATDLRTVAESADGWLDNADDAQWLGDESYQAEAWLNEHVAPEGYVFTFDEGFMLYAEDDLGENGEWTGQD